MALNVDPIDGWTVVHASVGVGMGALGIPRWVSLLAATGYEIIEYAHEYPNGSELFGSKRPESISNVLVDIAVFWVGYEAGKRL